MHWAGSTSENKKQITNSSAPGDDGLYNTTGRGKKDAWREKRGKESCFQKKEKKKLIIQVWWRKEAIAKKQTGS